MDELKVWHREWSKSEREKQIYYINAQVWNLEKWCRWIYLQGKNRGAGIREQRVLMKIESGELGSQIVLIEVREGPSMGEEHVLCR